MILLDTNVLIWWTSSPEKLSKKAEKIITTEFNSGYICISSISVWETYLLVKKNRLRFEIGIETWLSKIEKLPFVEFIPVNNSIAAKSVILPGEFHDDPADRIIVATAMEKEIQLVTSDEKIRKYPHVQTVW